MLLISVTSHAQNENSVTIQTNKTTNRVDNFSYATNYYHENKIVNNYIQLVDSIAHTTGVSGYFGRVYSKSMENIASQIQSMDSAAKLFIKKFEITFADYFLKACFDNKNGNLSSSSEWKCFFSSTAARPWQIVLLGVNTHINIDFWQALTDNFSEKEIRQNKKQLLACKSSVAKVYSPLFDTMIAENGYLRFVNSFTKGLAKKLGEKLMFKWRRRNINLAIMFYHDHEKFKKRWAIIKRKKQQIDKLILRKKNPATLSQNETFE